MAKRTEWLCDDCEAIWADRDAEECPRCGSPNITDTRQDAGDDGLE